MISSMVTSMGIWHRCHDSLMVISSVTMNWLNEVLRGVMVSVGTIVLWRILNDGVFNWVEIFWVVRMMVWNVHSCKNASLVPWVWSDIRFMIVGVIQFWVISVSDVIFNIVVNLLVWVLHVSLSMMNDGMTKGSFSVWSISGKVSDSVVILTVVRTCMLIIDGMSMSIMRVVVCSMM